MSRIHIFGGNFDSTFGKMKILITQIKYLKYILMHPNSERIKGISQSKSRRKTRTQRNTRSIKPIFYLEPGTTEL